MKKIFLGFSIIASLAISSEVEEIEIGKVEQCGMELAAVYLKPMDMSPKKDLQAKDADIHIEADIHALKENVNGFEEGDWIPYLGINYELKNLDNGASKKGTLVPMVAKDGPHYGLNIPMEKDRSKKFNPGNYKLTFHIQSPEQQGLRRHTDHQTGVNAWCDNFSVSYDFKYSGSLYSSSSH